MFNIIITVVGGLVLVPGLGSRWLEKSPLPPTLLALMAGIVLGPVGLGLIDRWYGRVAPQKPELGSGQP